MKKCPSCGRVYSDMVTVCPNCKVTLSAGTSGGAASPAGARNPVSGGSQNYAPPVSPVTQTPSAQPVQTPVQTPVPTEKTVKDSGNFLWAVPGIILPLIGWILWACWKSKKPKTAKVAAIGAWIGFFLNMALRFL